MTKITTHVLDTARGKPAQGIEARLEREERPGEWRELGAGVTDADGRIKELTPTGVAPGSYRLTFAVAAYLAGGFYKRVPIEFEVTAGQPHYHVPLLLSPFGYSTYRGS